MKNEEEGIEINKKESRLETWKGRRGEKVLGFEADQWLPYSVTLKNNWIRASASPIRLYGIYRDKLTFYILFTCFGGLLTIEVRFINDVLCIIYIHIKIYTKCPTSSKIGQV